MTEQQQNELGKALWDIANELRGGMNANDFQDYILSFLFLKYLSDNYEQTAKKQLGKDYPTITAPTDDKTKQQTPLGKFYENNTHDDNQQFENLMRRAVRYVITPEFLWSNIAELARITDTDLLGTLEKSFKHIEEKSFAKNYKGLFSEIHLNSEKLDKDHTARNKKLCEIIKKLNNELKDFSTETDILGDAYEYLIDKFAASGGKKAGEFYTPQQISNILSHIVTMDSQNPNAQTKNIESVLDFACGSGSLLLNVYNNTKNKGVKIYGQEKNITTYNLARMNMLLHGVKDTEFEIFHGDTLINEWDILNKGLA